MTTSASPIEQIRTQAIEIVRRLKAGSVQTKDTESITFAICQDDKTLKVTWPWKHIHNTSSKELIDALVKEMTS